jgi:hypothetical protein
MKLQYFGDVNDYIKYGLLRCFAETGFRVGVCWMLTAGDDRSDGGKTSYLKQPKKWQRHDPELYELLRHSLASPDGRQVHHIERSGLIPDGVFFDGEVPDNPVERNVWYGKALARLNKSGLLFFDPDNGIEVESKPKGRKDSSKYVYWDELELAWKQTPTLLVFQHFPHKKRVEYIPAIAREMRERLRESTVVALKAANVLFLLACRHADRKRHVEALRLIGDRWAPRIMEYS